METINNNNMDQGSIGKAFHYGEQVIHVRRAILETVLQLIFDILRQGCHCKKLSYQRA